MFNPELMNNLDLDTLKYIQEGMKMFSDTTPTSQGYEWLVETINNEEQSNQPDISSKELIDFLNKTIQAYIDRDTLKEVVCTTLHIEGRIDGLNEVLIKVQEMRNEYYADIIKDRKITIKSNV